MTERRLLVIGSQCEKLNRLSFLPDVATRLHALLQAPGPGGCVGVSLQGHPPGLLLDPTVDQAKDAIEAAIDQAAKAGATLILAYVGHGEFPDEMSGDFYLMPTNADKLTDRGAIHFANFLNDCLKPPQDRVELVVLLDTCHAGVGAWKSMERWATSRRGNLGFELLTATDDRATANAPLTREIIDILERGAPKLLARIHCRDVYNRLKDQERPAQHVAFNTDDGRHYLGRNIARDPGNVFWKESEGRDLILEQTEYFQPTPDLAALVAASQAHPVVVMTGEAGAGKSTLASALVRPELTGDLVPPGFVHAVAMLGQYLDQETLANDLVKQLRSSLPGFEAAIDKFGVAVTITERNKLDFLSKQVTGPLKHFTDCPEVRIVFDAFDQITEGARRGVEKLLEERPNPVRLIFTARPDTQVGPSAHTLLLGMADREALDRYLRARLVPEKARSAIFARSANHWLITRLLADAVLAEPDIDLAYLPATVNEAYAKLLSQAGAADAWGESFSPILGLLAVAGSGPVLPLRLLVRAAEVQIEAAEEAVRVVLSKLKGLIVRREAGTTEEHLGLFHSTLVDYLLGTASAEVGYEIDIRAAFRAMIKGINSLAPIDKHDRYDPIHRYAFFREADHLWALEHFEAAIGCLRARESNDPRENLYRSVIWLAKIRDHFGQEDHPSVLSARGSVAFSTGMAGDYRESLHLFQLILLDVERVFGSDHPETLTARSNVAMSTGEVGDYRESLRLFQLLLPDMERVHGRDHSATLRTRNNIASCTGDVGEYRDSLHLFQLLLPDVERVLGRDHPGTLVTRSNVASSTGEVGEYRDSLHLFQLLLPDMERVLGREHSHTLTTRSNIAGWTGKVGEFRESLHLFQLLLPDMERVLGRDHPDTLKTRMNVAGWTGDVGDFRESLRLFQLLLPDMERVLGRDHPETLTTRNNVANRTGDEGDLSESLRLLQLLLPDRERVLGHDHPATLRTRDSVALRTGEVGDFSESLRLFQLLLPDMERVLGRDHPETLRTRGNVALRTGEVGDIRESLRLFRLLLSDQERVYGLDHADTLKTRSNVASWTGRDGDTRESLRLFLELLPDMERVLGRDHPGTLNTLGVVGWYSIQNGDLEAGCRWFQEGLKRSEAKFGPESDLTGDFRNSIQEHGCKNPPSEKLIEPVPQTQLGG